MATEDDKDKPGPSRVKKADETLEEPDHENGNAEEGEDEDVLDEESSGNALKEALVEFEKSKAILHLITNRIECRTKTAPGGRPTWPDRVCPDAKAIWTVRIKTKSENIRSGNFRIYAGLDRFPVRTLQ